MATQAGCVPLVLGRLKDSRVTAVQVRHAAEFKPFPSSQDAGHGSHAIGAAVLATQGGRQPVATVPSGV